MTPFQIFLIPGEYALALICRFFSVQSGAMQPELHLALSTLLALVLWSWAIRICFELAKQALGLNRLRGRG
jgi:hypothetical protein